MSEIWQFSPLYFVSSTPVPDIWPFLYKYTAIKITQITMKTSSAVIIGSNDSHAATTSMGNNRPENLQHRCFIRNSWQGANPALQDVKWDESVCILSNSIKSGNKNHKSKQKSITSTTLNF